MVIGREYGIFVRHEGKRIHGGTCYQYDGGTLDVRH